MAVTVERLIATLEGRFDKFDRSLNRALGNTNRSFGRIEARGRQLENRMAQIGGGVGRRFVAALAAGISVRSFQTLADAATRIENTLKVAGLSGEELERVYGRLRDSALKNAAPFESLVELYGRAALVQNELGVSSEQLISFTDRIALALRVSGKSAQESAGALLQLSQALGSGVVRAEEFSSIVEGAPTILQAAAAGIKEAGGSVARLRQIMLDGELSSRALFDGFLAGAPMLEERAEGMQLTIANAMGNIGTALIDAARDFEKATGAAGSFADGINNVARAINAVDIEGFVSKIARARDALQGFLTEAANSGIMERFAEFMTGQELTVGQPINLETVEAERDLANLEQQIETLRQRIEANKEMAIDTSGAAAQLASLIQQANALRAAIAGVGSTSGQNYRAGTPGDPNALAQMAGGAAQRTATVLAPISISDYPVTGGAGGGGRGGRRGRVGGGGGRENEFQREIAQIRERTEAIRIETEALAGLNPLIEDYGFAMEKARASADLLVAAKRAGIEVTPELKANIDQLAEAYASASAEAEQTADSQDRVREAAEEFRDIGRDVLGGFIQDLRNGKSAAEALENALSRLADRALDMALDGIFGGFNLGSLFGGGRSILNSGGGFRGLIGYSSGTANTGGRRGQPRGVVHGQEAVIPLPNGGRVPVQMQGGGDVTVQINNAPPGTSAREERSRGPDGRQLRRIVVDVVSSEMAGGGFDKPLGARYGTRPTRVAR